MEHSERLAILDGWRAISILAVLAGHWLPLNPFIPHANEAVASTGMAIFFTLSGFLITRFLLERPQPGPFLIRRILRILPLAWSAMLLLYFAENAPEQTLAANMLFYANLPPARFFQGGAPLWSLCVEMQFYVAAAIVVLFGGRRGLYFLPVAGLLITLERIYAHATIDIVTWRRADEILAGATLALLYFGAFGDRVRAAFACCNFWVLAAIAMLCCYFLWTPLAYARPYAVAALVGISLFHSPRLFRALLVSRPAAYIAEISYALYVFHGMLTATWLGSGSLTVKYLKRPLLMAVTWLLAHLSTFHFEKHFIELARRLTGKPVRLSQI